MDRYRVFKSGIGLLTVLAVIAAMFALTGGAASADINGCPASMTGDPQVSNRVGATAVDNSGVVTYTFESFVTAGSGGVPGLIEYCVYPDSLPDGSVVTVATGANGAAWTDPTLGDNFSFQRPDGNPSNIPYDGASHTMGTAEWTGGTAATNFGRILLHINDPAECDRLYGGNPGTCFVLPGTGGQEASDLTISKDAAGSFDKTFGWTITKTGCKHGTGPGTNVDCVTSVKQVGGSVLFDYMITVTKDGGTISNVLVTGTITVNNPNSADVKINGVTDQLSDGTTVCTVTDGGAQFLSPGTTLFSYTCLAGTPDNSLTNTATVSWGDQVLGDGSHLDGSSVDSTPPTPITFAETDHHNCVDVTDPNSPNPPLPAHVCVTTTFTYSKSITVPQFDCKSYTNTATFVASDDSTYTKHADATVTVCGPAKTGALTMGFWQNKNGQGIITGGSSTGGVCNSGTWLRQFAPFQDLSATATCAQVATYVYNVIKAANSSGSSMNPMLKAQMLATALDVYFSDPALGTNKINAPTPIGGIQIDLTMICKMIDGSGGTATCSGTYYDTSSAFGGATCPTVLALLTYAAGQSNSGGTSWYGQVKTTQEKAKNTFDAINNQVVFKC